MDSQTDAARILVNGKCQYHCHYCPLGMERSKPLEETVPLDRLVPVVERLAELGFSRFEITGGEPLLCSNVAELVARIHAVDGVSWVGITTNGLLLQQKLTELKDAGLDALNIHVDTTYGAEFHEVTGVEKVLNDILNGIWQAVAKDFDVCITSALLKSTADSLPVTVALAKTFPITVRLADVGPLAGEDRLALSEATRLLEEGLSIRRDPDTGRWDTGDWKGTVTEGTGIAGAFGMEDAWVLDVSRP